MRPYTESFRFVLLLLFIALASGCSSETATSTSPLPTPGNNGAPAVVDTPTIVVIPSAEARLTPDATKDATLFEVQREGMVDQGLVAWGITDSAVLEVMGEIPRHEFVPEDLSHLAYANHPLPIGYGQTISQPYIVALMTEALNLSEGDKVLEIGTGSGYQAAVLSQLVDQVFTIEIIAPIADRAALVHNKLGYENISGRTADGYYGWEEEAPFDAIIVTAAPDHIPQPLVQQLKVGGRMVIPVGPIGGVQTLWLIVREEDESIRTENLGSVRFVPLTREDETELDTDS